MVSASGQEQWATVSTSGSYQSSNDKRAHFGLGKDTVISQVELQWPSGVTQKLEQVKADQILTVKEPPKK